MADNDTMISTIDWTNITANVTSFQLMTREIDMTTTPSSVAEGLSGLVDAATKESVVNVVQCYLLPVVVLFGVCGNVMSFVVLLVHGTKTSTNVLLLGVTVSDFGLLVSMYARKISCIVKHFDVLLAMKIETALIPNVYMVNRAFTLTTPFLTMIITLERCLAVVVPFKVQSLVTSLRMKVVVVSIFIFAFLAELPFFLVYQIKWTTDPQSGESIPRLSGTPFFLQNYETITVYNNIVLSAIFNYAPMSVVVICTAIVITTIKRSARWRKLTSQQSESGDEDRMTLLLMTVVAVYIACYLPRCAVLIANSLAPDSFNSLGGRYGNLFYLISSLQTLLYALNSSANFVVYMALSSKFYNTYKRIFLCHKMRGLETSKKSGTFASRTKNSSLPSGASSSAQ